MTSSIIFLILLVVCNRSNGEEANTFLGCFRDPPNVNLTYINSLRTPAQCTQICSDRFFRYAMVRNETLCLCSNQLGVEYNRTFCKLTCDNCDLKATLSDIYFASNVVIGPPRNFKVTNVTETSVYLSWDEPSTLTEIENYKVTSYILHTYTTSIFLYNKSEWSFSNTNKSSRAEIVTLHPGTKYNITVQGIPPDGDGEGAVVYQVFQTRIGDPDETPLTPDILTRDKTKMTIQMKPVTNNNGPIVSYLIVVLDSDSVQTFDSENLKSYRDATYEGLSYYVTAEIPPKDVTKPFTIGDGNMYKKYYNAPLDAKRDYTVLLGVKSQDSNSTKVLFSNQPDISVKIMDIYEEDSPALIIALSIAIGLLSVLLIASIVGFIVLRNRILHRNRQRLNDNQELTFQGPMISMDNSGYIPEDEMTPANHYENLNEQVWIIPRNLLNIQHTCLLGSGKFGLVHSGTVHKDNILKTVAVYSIADGKLLPFDKRAMLKDLDTLIRSEKHENVIELIGTCESIDTVCVVLEYVSANLKELLLGCRNNSPGFFCNISCYQLLDIATNIAKGMAHLESKNIVHKQLCARNISIVNGFTPKISGFGLAQYYENDLRPVYVRWTAKEVFRGQSHVPKSAVWSFACVLWEICALGGTPYGNIPNSEIPDRVIRNQLLNQLQYVGDTLYQLMLNCWQIDLDERPTFFELLESLYEIKEDKFNTYLLLDTYPGFQYEQYFPELELTTS